MQELSLMNPAEQYRIATDVAGLCGEIVKKTARELGFANQRRKYVQVEGWMAIATAHGCVASSRDVEWVPRGENDETAGGFRAIGEIHRLSDGALIATAQGFVGEDEPMWFGGEKEVWNSETRRHETKTYEKRPDSAIRAMAQTRAIGRVCRSAFAHVIVLIDENLATTPAEDIDEENGHEHGRPAPHPETPKPAKAARKTAAPQSNPEDQTNPMADLPDNWQDIICTYGRKDGNLRGKKLGILTPSNRRFLYDRFIRLGKKDVSHQDRLLVMGLELWAKENPQELEAQP